MDWKFTLIAIGLALLGAFMYPRGYLKEIAIKRFVRTLRSLLETRYGIQESYTPEQIDKTFDEHFASKEKAYIWYAYAMYSRASHFERVCQKRGVKHDFAHMRSEMIAILQNPADKARISGDPGAAGIDGHYDRGSANDGDQ